MPDKSFKVSIYEIELPGDKGSVLTPFSTAISNACALPLADRYKEVNGKGRRLEDDDQREGCYLLNFVTLEFAGPGRSAPATAAISINLAQDESFAHETAMLYDPDVELMFAESVQGGMGPGAIARYFREFANHGEEYSLIPRLDNEAAARARQHQTIRRLTMRVAMGPITESDRNAGIGVIKSFGDEYGAGTIDIEIKAQRERGRTLSISSIWNTITNILGDHDENNVTQLKVYGREHDDDALEDIDLLQHREKRERILPVDDQDRKISRDNRWDALLEIRREFLA